MTPLPGIQKLAEDAVKLAQSGYEFLPNGVWRVSEDLIAGEIDRQRHALGDPIKPAQFIGEWSDKIPFLGECGLIGVRKWYSGRVSTTYLLEFDDGNLGLVRADLLGSNQPRWPYGGLIQPWWRKFANHRYYEIQLFGFVPENYKPTHSAGHDISNRIADLWEELSGDNTSLKSADYSIWNLPTGNRTDGYLFLPDGTPYLFDPGEIAFEPRIHGGSAEAILSLTTTKARKLYKQDVNKLQLLLDTAFDGCPPFSYVFGQKNKLDHFLPAPAKLAAAVKHYTAAPSPARPGNGAKPDTLEP